MLYLEINKDNKRFIKLQIYNQLREKILCGDLESGMRLPSSRELASELNISGNTVLSAYEMLISEGYAVSMAGSGVYVNKGVQAIRQTNEIMDIRYSSISNDVITKMSLILTAVYRLLICFQEVNGTGI